MSVRKDVIANCYHDYYSTALHSYGNGKYKEQYCPLLFQTKQVQVEDYSNITVMNVMAQITQRDIAIMNNKTHTPPEQCGVGMLGVVVGTTLSLEKAELRGGFKYGDIVSIFKAPAFSDFWNYSGKHLIRVHGLHPRHIIYPVGVGMYVANQEVDRIRQLVIAKITPTILIIGSGIMAWVIWSYLRYLFKDHIKLRSYGAALARFWHNKRDKLKSNKNQYDFIFDVTDKNVLNTIPHAVHELTRIVSNANREVNQLPQTVNFTHADFDNAPLDEQRRVLQYAERLITRQIINVDYFWGTCYNRYSEWESAFVDTANRTNKSKRNFLYWSGLDEHFKL